MPKIQCSCGNFINLSGIPSRDQYLFISDTDFDQFHGTVDAEEVYDKMKICIQCPSCMRLYVYEQDFDTQPLVYIVEQKEK